MGRARARGKGKGKADKGKGKDKALNSDLDLICHNCSKKGHKKADCWAKGGGKEGQGPKQRKGKKTETATVAAVDEDDKELLRHGVHI